MSSSSSSHSSVRSLPLRGICSLHHFAAPISSARNASISPAFWRNRFLTVFVHAVDLVIGPLLSLEVTDHFYMVLLVELSKVTSFCSLRRPISALMSASSLSWSPLWTLTFTSRVDAPAWTFFCSLIIIIHLYRSYDWAPEVPL